jgi:flagellar biosynthetic protein FlhB
VADSDSNKTEKPTPERLRKAREEGQFAHARDAGGIAASIGALITFAAIGPLLARQLQAFAAHCFGHPFDLTRGGPSPMIERAVSVLALLTLPAAFAAAVLALLAAFGQAGFHPRFQLMLPKWERMDPIARMKGMLGSFGAFAELGISFGRIAVVGYVAYATLRDSLPALTRLASAGVLSASSELFRSMSALTIRATVALALLAVVDYIQSKIRLDKNLMMTREEVREEIKQHEGDPRIRGRLRQRMRERLKRALVKQVKQSDVVVTNPTHVAVALRYKRSDVAPVVTAKGFDDIALHIRKLAREAGVPIIENRMLARELAERVRVGKSVPVELYQAVAEVLAFVYRLKAKSVWI